MNKVTVFVQEHLSKTSFQGPLIEKQYCVLGMQARLFAWLCDFYALYRMPVQYWQQDSIWFVHFKWKNICTKLGSRQEE